MSYKVFGGIHDILASISSLKSIPANQREKGQMVAVRDGDYKIYIWDPTATAKGLLCSLAGEDPAQTLWPSKASMWYPGAQGQNQNLPATFIERDHMVEENNVRFEQGIAVRDDFGYLFAVPNDISNDAQGNPVDYTGLPGRWVVINYATLVDNIPWSTRAGHLIPRYNAKFDIGNADLKVRHHFLSDNSIWLGEQHRVTVNVAGTLKFQKRKTGKIPEHLNTHAASAFGSADEAKRAILEQIKSDPDIPATELDSIGSITTSTDIPETMNLSLAHWEKIAKVQGFLKPEPGTLFGNSDFEDAVNLESSSAPSNDDIDTRLADVESKFDVLGKIDKDYVDPGVFDLPEYINKWNERLALETDIIRGNFDNLFDTRLGTKDVIGTPEFGTLYDGRFNNDFDTRFGTKDVVIGTTDWADMQDRFDVSGRLKTTNAHPDLVNANVPATDLSGYATLGQLGSALANKADVSSIPDVTGYLQLSDMDQVLGKTVPSGATDTIPNMLAGKTTVSDVEAYITSNLSISAETNGQIKLAIKGEPSHFNATNSTWLGGNSILSGMASDIAGKQEAGTYLTDASNIAASKITGTVAASKISSAIARTVDLTAVAGDVAALDSTVGGLNTDVNNINSWKTSTFSEGSGNLAIDKLPYALFADSGTYKGTLHSSVSLSDGTSLNTKISSFNTSINSLQTSVTSLDSSLTFTPLVAMSFPTSDKDLKSIIRVVPQNEITTNYHLLGLVTFEYEWNQVATDLFSLSGHVEEGFLAEQLEELYPPADPQNPPTSKEDGHIWWHEYMTEDQKASSSGVHNYYTFFNSEMLQAEIDAAIAAL